MKEKYMEPEMVITDLSDDVLTSSTEFVEEVESQTLRNGIFQIGE